MMKWPGTSPGFPDRKEIINAQPADPRLGHWLLRGARRLRLPVLRPARPRFRLVRDLWRHTGVRVGWSVGLAGDRRRNRVAPRRRRPLGATAVGADLRPDRRGLQ